MVLFATASSHHHKHSSKSTNSLFKELELELENAAVVNKVLSRIRRVPAPGDVRACGRKLVLFVLSVCGEPCGHSTSQDIATTCCEKQCSEADIKDACCPQKEFTF
ncbi:unnamed protein product [Caenorhabditis brenneri]